MSNKSNLELKASDIPESLVRQYLATHYPGLPEAYERALDKYPVHIKRLLLLILITLEILCIGTWFTEQIALHTLGELLGLITIFGLVIVILTPTVKNEHEFQEKELWIQKYDVAYKEARNRLYSLVLQDMALISQTLQADSNVNTKKAKIAEIQESLNDSLSKEIFNYALARLTRLV